jgi:hypothetical protein
MCTGNDDSKKKTRIREVLTIVLIWPRCCFYVVFLKAKIELNF